MTSNAIRDAMQAYLSTLIAPLSSARRQIAANPRLRVALFLAAGLCWLYGLFWLADFSDAQERQAREWNEEASRVAPLARAQDQWSRRKDDALVARARMLQLSWRAEERGLSEANLQDWLRTVCAKAGLNIRELRMMAEVTASSESTPKVATGEFVPMRVRLSVDFRRVPALGLLAELARNEPAVAVDRWVVRTNAQIPVMELELRALASVPGSAR